jgi:hypothetical protein
MLETEDKKERELIKALEIGEQSGFVEDFDPNQNLTEFNIRRAPEAMSYFMVGATFGLMTQLCSNAVRKLPLMQGT